MPYADPEKKRASAAERTRRWRAAHPEKARQSANETKRRWREANPERVRQEGREQMRLWREANPEKVLESARRYREANPEKHRAAVRHSAARWKHGPNHLELRAELLARQDGRCYLCDEAMPPGGSVIEHDHSCPHHSPERSCPACVRGLACHNCNTLIGLAGDSPGRLRLVARNLEKARKAAAERMADGSIQLSLGDLEPTS